ncbi:hypothetical protein HZH66_005489 [Vespula vulgaris]|uniref:Uncharacterized protein n=1 Tax=Vespula vulgaris TaxID=7454 RepID=A0A834N838_VESVU|nr:hypothetical protein HZH66_005489 [Vespula vulgaris]
MGSKCPRKCKPEDNENNEAEADPEKREVVQRNSTESASVQAKMSLDLIVEQLKREISLKDIEDEEQSVSATEGAAEPKDLFESAFEEGPKVVEHEDEDEGEDEETTDAADVNAVSMNLEKFETEERETIDRQEEEEETISPREPVENDMVTENRLERDNDDVGFASMFVIGPKKSSDSSEERKINEGGNTSTKDDDKDEEEEEEEEGGFKDRETQTERVHTIHAARSCPLRKRCIYRFFFADPRNRAELFGWIHRKASDNLIYEKGKASGSPSYVPLTERFRWRYVEPRKAR